METVLRYELSADGKGLRKFVRNPKKSQDDAPASGPVWFHVHSDEMTELERWIHSLLSSPNVEKLLTHGR